MNHNMSKRMFMYLTGLFAMTIGIALSVKSDLGVSPVSSIPYTMTCIWGIEMGKATILFHCFLVLLQIILLRKKYQMKNLLQIAVGVLFGYFTTFCNWGVGFLPDPQNIIIRICMLFISTIFIAIGIFLYLPPDIMPLAGEGAMQAVSTVSGIPFPKVKIGFDISMVVISLITCLAFIKSFGSVGIGTIIAAVLVGTELGIISKRFGDQRDRWLGKKNELQAGKTDTNTNHYIVTISREYGSGGREIGKKLAANLGIKYYDLDIIRKAAKKSELSEKIIEQNEQSVKNPVSS